MRFKSSLINQNSGVSLQASESAHNVVVNLLDLPDSSGVLEMGDRFLLYSKDDSVLALNADSSCASVDCFEGVLDLEQFAVWGEDRDGFVVSRHCKLNY